jgi:hypothetical protein
VAITPTKMSKSRMISAIVDNIAVILLVWKPLFAWVKRDIDAGM